MSHVPRTNSHKPEFRRVSSRVDSGPHVKTRRSTSLQHHHHPPPPRMRVSHEDFFGSEMNERDMALFADRDRMFADSRRLLSPKSLPATSSAAALPTRGISPAASPVDETSYRKTKASSRSTSPARDILCNPTQSFPTTLGRHNNRLDATTTTTTTTTNTVHEEENNSSRLSAPLSAIASAASAAMTAVVPSSFTSATPATLRPSTVRSSTVHHFSHTTSKANNNSNSNSSNNSSSKSTSHHHSSLLPELPKELQGVNLEAHRMYRHNRTLYGMSWLEFCMDNNPDDIVDISRTRFTVAPPLPGSSCPGGPQRRSELEAFNATCNYAVEAILQRRREEKEKRAREVAAMGQRLSGVNHRSSECMPRGSGRRSALSDVLRLSDGPSSCGIEAATPPTPQGRSTMAYLWNSVTSAVFRRSSLQPQSGNKSSNKSDSVKGRPSAKETPLAPEERGTPSRPLAPELGAALHADEENTGHMREEEDALDTSRSIFEDTLRPDSLSDAAKNIDAALAAIEARTQRPLGSSTNNDAVIKNGVVTSTSNHATNALAFSPDGSSPQPLQPDISHSHHQFITKSVDDSNVSASAATVSPYESKEAKSASKRSRSSNDTDSSPRQRRRVETNEANVVDTAPRPSGLLAAVRGLLLGTDVSNNVETHVEKNVQDDSIMQTPARGSHTNHSNEFPAPTPLTRDPTAPAPPADDSALFTLARELQSGIIPSLIETDATTTAATGTAASPMASARPSAVLDESTPTPQGRLHTAPTRTTEGSSVLQFTTEKERSDYELGEYLTTQLLQAHAGAMACQCAREEELRSGTARLTKGKALQDDGPLAAFGLTYPAAVEYMARRVTVDDLVVFLDHQRVYYQRDSLAYYREKHCEEEQRQQQLPQEAHILPYAALKKTELLQNALYLITQLMPCDNHQGGDNTARKRSRHSIAAVADAAKARSMTTTPTPSTTAPLPSGTVSQLPTDAWSVKQLREYAATHHINLHNASRKRDILAVIHNEFAIKE